MVVSCFSYAFLLHHMSPGIKYLLKNSLAVKKGAALFKIASVKKVMKLKGAAK